MRTGGHCASLVHVSQLAADEGRRRRGEEGSSSARSDHQRTHGVAPRQVRDSLIG